jgi:hypothetical protein
MHMCLNMQKYNCNGRKQVNGFDLAHQTIKFIKL